MPKIKYIASTRQAVPRSQGLSPNTGLLSPRTGQVSVSGAALRNPGSVKALIETPTLTNDLLGPKIAQAGREIGKAALRYSEEQATLQAKDAAVKYQKRARGEWLGASTKNGFSPGYASTKGKTSAEGYHGFTENLQNLRDGFVSELKEKYGDLAASKFVASTQGIHDNYLNQGAQHAASGKIAWDQDVLKQQINQSNLDIDNQLTAGNYQAVLATLAKDLQNVPVPQRAAAAQARLNSVADFLASTDGAPTKLQVWQDLAASQFNVATATHFNTLMYTATQRENQKDLRAEATSERVLVKQKQKNDLNLFTASIEDPASINLEEMMALTQSGMLSPSLYLSVRNRVETKDYLPEISAQEEYSTKRAFIRGDVSATEVMTDILDYNDSSMRRMGSFILKADSYARREDLRYGYDKIQKVISKVTVGLQGIKDTLETQRRYEVLLDKHDAETALNMALQPFAGNLNNEASYTPEAFLLSNGQVLQPQNMRPAQFTGRLDALLRQGEITVEEHERASGEALRYYQSQKN